MHFMVYDDFRILPHIFSLMVVSCTELMEVRIVRKVHHRPFSFYFIVCAVVPHVTSCAIARHFITSMRTILSDRTLDGRNAVLMSCLPPIFYIVAPSTELMAHRPVTKDHWPFSITVLLIGLSRALPLNTLPRPTILHDSTLYRTLEHCIATRFHFATAHYIAASRTIA